MKTKHIAFILTLAGTAQSFAAMSFINITDKGKSPASNLKIKSSKVPQYDLAKKSFVDVVISPKEKQRISLVPKVDPGVEKTLQYNANELVLKPQPEAKNYLQNIVKIEPIKIDALVKSITSSKVTTLPSHSSPSLSKVEEYEKIQDLKYEEPNPVIKNINQFSETEYKLIEGLIFLQTKKNFPVALGVFAQTQTDPKLKNESTYQLALTAKKLGLHSEFRHQMTTLLNDKNPDWKKAAASQLVENLDKDGYDMIPEIDKVKDQYELTIQNDLSYNLIRAKYYLDTKNYTMANAALEEIEAKDKNNAEGLFLKSLFLYGTGKIDDAMKTIAESIKIYEKVDPQNDNKSLAALTLARLYFQKGDYKDAYDNYLKVNKSHSLWLQGIIEQAWAQILYKDYEGAAGNMFSLHTAYFKGAFKPETYIVRTIAYLNLCQFGDASNTLESVKRTYVPYVERLEKYQKGAKAPLAYYELAKAWLKNPTLKEVEQVPRSFIAELASHPNFLNLQKIINSLEDQNESFLQITKDIVTLERTYTQKILASQDKMSQLEVKIAQAKDAKLKEQFNFELGAEANNIVSFKEQQTIVKNSRNAVKEVREKSMTRIDAEKQTIRLSANEVLKTRYAMLSENLIGILDQAELLQYENLSGAGEHLRYQMAGGQVKDQPKKELKPEKDKSTRWTFSGEIWEDEVGHYRSSLKSVCSDEDK